MKVRHEQGSAAASRRSQAEQRREHSEVADVLAMLAA